MTTFRKPDQEPRIAQELLLHAIADTDIPKALPGTELVALGGCALGEPLGVNERNVAIYAVHDLSQGGRVFLSRTGQNQANQYSTVHVRKNSPHLSSRTTWD